MAEECGKRKKIMQKSRKQSNKTTPISILSDNQTNSRKDSRTCSIVFRFYTKDGKYKKGKKEIQQQQQQKSWQD